MDDVNLEIARRPIPFLERAESAYEQIRDSMFSAAEHETRDNLRALDVLLARSSAVIESREAALRGMGRDNGQSISG